MYIRWKIKPRANEYGKPVNLLIAYLAESHRVNGKPRQKTTYLASIKDNRLEHHKEYFWAKVDTIIQHLPDEQKQKIEQKLSEKVPRPSHQATQEAQQYRNQLMEKFKQA